MRKLILVMWAVAAVGAMSTARAGEYEYIFVSDPATPSNPNDGSPISDWGGALFLDSGSSAGGSLGDINLSESYINTSYGDFSLADPSIAANGGLTLNAPFTWNSAGITSMDIRGLVDFAATGGIEYPFRITDSEIHIETPDPTDLGSWVAAPDATSTGWLLGMVGAGLASIQRFGRKPVRRG
jgi:hypothetical protein